MNHSVCYVFGLIKLMADNYKLAHKCTMKSQGVLVMGGVPVGHCASVNKRVLEAYILKRKDIFIWKHIYRFKGNCNAWYSSTTELDEWQGGVCGGQQPRILGNVVTEEQL